MRAKAMAQQHAAAMAKSKSPGGPPTLSPMKPTGLKIKLKLPPAPIAVVGEDDRAKRKAEKRERIRLKREKKAAKLLKREKRAERDRLQAEEDAKPVKVVTPLKLKLPKMEPKIEPEVQDVRPQVLSPVESAPTLAAAPAGPMFFTSSAPIGNFEISFVPNFT